MTQRRCFIRREVSIFTEHIQVCMFPAQSRYCSILLSGAPEELLQEILALTKMNWNSTRFVNAEPITLSAARNVGAILKYVSNDTSIQARYSYYM